MKNLICLFLLAISVSTNSADFSVNDSEPEFILPEKKFNYCDEKQEKEIKSAIYYAKEMIKIVQTDDNNLTKWFGNDDNSDVKQTYQNIALALDNPDVRFDCGCAIDVHAYVEPSQPFVFHLCNDFWRSELVGYNSKAGTLIHETSHFEIILNSKDIAIEYKMALRFSNQPILAKLNANSYEFAAEEIYRKKTKKYH